MEAENTYLLKALNEVKCVVLVKQYTKAGTVSRSRMEYVSPNAGILGMNVSALLNGYRLAEDYIHPDDRDDFLDAVDIACNEKNDFSYSVRLVGDDGQVREVNIVISISDLTETGYLLEYIIRETSEKAESVAVPKAVVSDYAFDEFETNAELFENNRIADVVQSIAGLDDLYSTIVDLDGKIVVKPAGPVTYMGEFYDMFERPMYKNLYEKIKHDIITYDEPIYMEMEDGNPESRISAAPIVIGGKHVATWLLCAYSKEQAERLSHAFEHQWMIAELVSEYLFTIYETKKKAGMVKQTEQSLEFEIKQKEIITDALSRMSQDIDAALLSMFEEAGKLLNLDNVILYAEKDKKTHLFGLKKYWTANGNKIDESLNVTWSRESFLKEEQKAIEAGGFVYDHSNITNSIRVSVLQGRMRAVIIYPVVVDGSFMGWLLFMENQSERVWTDSEKLFTKELSSLVNRMMKLRIGEGSLNRINKILLDTYNQIKVGIFIRDICTGNVLFSNEKLNSMLGYDFKGKDSRLLLTDLHDKFENIADIQDNTLADNKVIRWTRYIDAFDAIVDITEIQIDWLNGQPASLIILRLAQD